MTLEEAKSLGPGDMIQGTWGDDIRTIVTCQIEDDHLYWFEKFDSKASEYAWRYSNITLHKKVHNTQPTINNEYSIF